ncbi:MAG: hypothetical protein QXE50_05895 [Nitrososphaerota archaeon]
MPRIIRWSFPLLRQLSTRPTLIFEKPPIHEVFETQMLERQLIVHPVDEIDGELEEMIRRKKSEWGARGVGPNLQDMAVDLAREWTRRIVEWHLRNLRDVLPEEELKRVTKSLTVRVMEDALNKVAERWISALRQS